VKGEDLVKPDESFDLLDGVIPTRGSADVVAGSEEMGRVQTNPESRRSADVVVKGSEVFDGMAKAGALTGGIFKRNSNGGFAGGAKDFVKGIASLTQALGIAGAEMSTRMENKKWELELIGELDFLDERLDGAIEVRRRRGGNVDEITGMTEKMSQVRVVPGVTVSLEFGRSIRTPEPLHVVLDENLDGFASAKKATFNGFVRAAGSGTMHPETHQGGMDTGSAGR
jgi:hypothetical protein